jgi:hypothetical protein
MLCGDHFVAFLEKAQPPEVEDWDGDGNGIVDS